MVEIKQPQQIELGLEPRILLIEFYEISCRTVSFLLNESDVMLLLELQHLVFAIPKILLDLDQLFRDRGGHVAALVGAHTFLDVEILLHDGGEVGLRVLRRRANRFQLEN